MFSVLAPAAAAGAMAARKLLVTPLSRPAKNIFLQRPQKSPSINPARRFLLSSNPKPNHPNPVHASTRPFSNKPESDRRQRWQTEYRRHLGINDSLVLLDVSSFQPPKDEGNFQPPKHGEIKITFCGTLAEDHFDDDVGDGDDASARTGDIDAVARNSSGEVLGVARGCMKYSWRQKQVLQLYALKAAVNLANALKHRGIHDGPVVYEASTYALVTALFHDGCEGHPEAVLRRIMPRDEDLEEVARSCPIYFATKEDLKDMPPRDVRKEEEAQNAPAASTASSQAHLEYTCKERRYACFLRGGSIITMVYSTCPSVWPGETPIMQV